MRLKIKLSGDCLRRARFGERARAIKGVNAQLAEMNVRLTRVEQETNDLRRLFRSGFIDLARVQDKFDERLEKLEGRNAPK